MLSCYLAEPVNRFVSNLYFPWGCGPLSMPAISRGFILTPCLMWPKISFPVSMWAWKPKLPGSWNWQQCDRHFYLHTSHSHSYPTSTQESVAAVHSLSTKAFIPLFISGAWWVSFLACTLGYSLTIIFVVFYLGACGRRIYAYPIIFLQSISFLGFTVIHINTVYHPSTPGPVW